MNIKVMIQALFVACFMAYVPLPLACMESNKDDTLVEEVSQRFNDIFKKNKTEIQTLKRVNMLYKNKFNTEEATKKANKFFNKSKRLLRTEACEQIVQEMNELKVTTPEHYTSLCQCVLFPEGIKKSKLIKQIEKRLLNMPE